MDSVNLPEAQSTPLNFKNTACNTSPIACTCCGPKDYVQTFPQAYCFAPLSSGMPRCKHSQENYEENFSFQQSFFSRFPLFPSFYHSSAIPSNSCCAHNYGDNTIKEQFPSNEHESTRTGNHYKSCPRERNDFRDNKNIVDEDAKKQKNLLSPEFPLLWSPFSMSYSTESQNSFFQRCTCNDSIPWTYSPFIAPIVSYCLFWNSQKANMNVLSTNYNVGKSENLCHSENEIPPSQNSSNSNNEKEKFSNNLDLTEKKNCSSSEVKNFPQQSSFEVEQQIENTGQNSGNSSSFLSLNSLNYTEENNSKSLEKEDQIRAVDTCGGEEDTETEGFDSDQEESDEGLKSDKKILSNNNSDVDLSLNYNKDLKDNKCQSPSTSQSLTDLKTRKNSTHSMDVLLSEIQPSNNSGAGENAFHSLQDSDDETEKTTSLNKDLNFKRQISFKKFIKNFTMTDQTDIVPLDEAQISVAAAGDLGGLNCEGFKVDIAAFEEYQQETVRRNAQTQENSESTELILKGLRNCEENKLESFPEKNINENLKSKRSAKTGIAKLLHNLKSKESKSDPVENTKQNREPNAKESAILKRKHNCFSNDNAVAIADKNTKIHKTRNYAVFHQQSTGAEKQHKETNNKSQPVKKEEKISPTKVRPASITQKTIKCSAKK